MSAKKTPSRRIDLSADRSTKPLLHLSPSAAILEAIEQERARLMQVEAVLHCVSVAMDEADGDVARAPYHQAAITVACELLGRSIDRLDSVRLRPLLESLQSHGPNVVRERVATYLLQ